MSLPIVSGSKYLLGPGPTEAKPNGKRRPIIASGERSSHTLVLSGPITVGTAYFAGPGPTFADSELKKYYI